VYIGIICIYVFVILPTTHPSFHPYTNLTRYDRIKTLPGKEGAMRKLLVQVRCWRNPTRWWNIDIYIHGADANSTITYPTIPSNTHTQLIDASETDESNKGMLSTMAVNQDPEDRRNFLMLVRALVGVCLYGYMCR
jgi:hypothetical protein